MKQKFFIEPGQRYGELTALQKMGTDKWKAVQWEFLCSCGNITIRTGSQVARGTMTHCGCLTPTYMKRDGWRFQKGDQLRSAARVVWRSIYRDGCSFEDFIRLSQEPCHYCGTKELTSRFEYHKDRSTGVIFRYNGLDRLDSTKNHAPENIVTACQQCNYAKQSVPYQEFLNWIRQVHSHLAL